MAAHEKVTFGGQDMIYLLEAEDRCTLADVEAATRPIVLAGCCKSGDLSQTFPTTVATFGSKQRCSQQIKVESRNWRPSRDSSEVREQKERVNRVK
jgi:hypothetical protein